MHHVDSSTLLLLVFASRVCPKTKSENDIYLDENDRKIIVLSPRIDGKIGQKWQNEDYSIGVCWTSVILERKFPSQKKVLKTKTISHKQIKKVLKKLCNYHITIELSHLYIFHYYMA